MSSTPLFCRDITSPVAWRCNVCGALFDREHLASGHCDRRCSSCNTQLPVHMRWTRLCFACHTMHQAEGEARRFEDTVKVGPHSVYAELPVWHEGEQSFYATLNDAVQSFEAEGLDPPRYFYASKRVWPDLPHLEELLRRVLDPTAHPEPQAMRWRETPEWRALRDAYQRFAATCKDHQLKPDYRVAILPHVNGQEPRC